MDISTDDREAFNGTVAAMQSWQDKLDAADWQVLPEVMEQWREARVAILKTAPTSTACAVALLRWIASEADAEDIDRATIVEAILRCVDVLENDAKIWNN